MSSRFGSSLACMVVALGLPQCTISLAVDRTPGFARKGPKTPVNNLLQTDRTKNDTGANDKQRVKAFQGDNYEHAGSAGSLLGDILGNVLWQR